jgi:hypothetical protein
MPLNSLQPPNKRKFALLTAAFLLLVLAGAGMAMAGNNFAIRSLAIVAALAGVACVRRINVHAPPGSATEAPQQGGGKLATLIRHPIGIISLILVPIMAMASFFLYKDAVQGYHESWPLYLFFWTGIICTLCWAYVVSTLHGP